MGTGLFLRGPPGWGLLLPRGHDRICPLVPTQTGTGEALRPHAWKRGFFPVWLDRRLAKEQELRAFALTARCAYGLHPMLSVLLVNI
jgi:hypothetical protein